MSENGTQLFFDQVTLAGAIADLAELGMQRSSAGEIEFGDVRQVQQGARERAQAVTGGLAVGVEDGGVGDVGAVHQVITAAQGVGVVELRGEAVPGMLDETVSQIGQRGRAPPVAEAGPAKNVAVRSLG